MRTWLYVSGVLFSLQALSLTLTASCSTTTIIAYLLQINPVAVYITLIRNALLALRAGRHARGPAVQRGQVPPLPASFPARHRRYSAYCHPVLPGIPELWLWGAGWAVVAVVIGFLFFWRAEARYGRG